MGGVGSAITTLDTKAGGPFKSAQCILAKTIVLFFWLRLGQGGGGSVPVATPVSVHSACIEHQA